MIANATLNMISPSLQQTWVSAVERVVCGSLGIIGGFYCGWFFPDPWVGVAITVVAIAILSRLLRGITSVKN